MDAAPVRSGPPPSVWIASAGQSESDGLPAALKDLGLTEPRPALVLVGGAANLPESVAGALLRLFEDLAPRLDALGAAVIDGGTACGVMALMGRARGCSAARFPLLGIAPRGSVVLADGSEDASDAPEKARLDPNHTHFILVPGARWGDESSWISAAADRLAGGRGSLMLVAAGGDITRLDVLHRLRAGGRVVTLAGSGGTAEQLADWRRDGRGVPDLDAGETERALIEVLDLADAHGTLPALVERAFSH